MGASEYREYIASEGWRFRRRKYLESVGWICEQCGRSELWHKEIFGRGLNVHHKSYARLGEELDSDLMALCIPCHAAREGREMPNGPFIPDDSESRISDLESGISEAYSRIDEGTIPNLDISLECAEKTLSKYEWLLEFVEHCPQETFTEMQVKELLLQIAVLHNFLRRNSEATA